MLEKSHPGIASLIRGSDRKINCWADLILQSQHDFDPHDVATAFRRLSIAGWTDCIVYAWCPITKPLWEKYCELKSERDSLSADDGTRDWKLKAKSLWGSIVVMRDLWIQTRRTWMRRHAIGSETDSSFFWKIIIYLERLANDDGRSIDAQNNG